MDTIKALLVFAQVMDSGSMSAAAKELGVSPSAISQHLRQLEKHHGMKLLNRTTRQLSPTMEGHLLLQGARQIRQVWRQTQQALEQWQTEFKGEVRLSLPSGFLDSLPVQAFLRQLAQRHPHIDLHLLPDDSVINLFDAPVDIAIRAAEPPPDSPLVARYLAAWPLGIYAAPNYLRRHPVLRPADLGNAQWIVHNDTVFDHAFHSLELGHFHAGRVIRCDAIVSARTLALLGHGLTLQLSGEAGRYIEKGELVQVLPAHPLPKYNIYAVTPHRAQSAKISAVAELLKTAFAE